MMRSLLLLAFVLVSATVNAEVIQEGFAPGNEKAAGAMICYKEGRTDAQIANTLNPTGLVELCTGSHSIEPLNCFKKVQNDPVIKADNLNTNGMIWLCSGATSIEPVACYKAAKIDPTSKDLSVTGIIRLCGTGRANNLN